MVKLRKLENKKIIAFLLDIKNEEERTIVKEFSDRFYGMFDSEMFAYANGTFEEGIGLVEFGMTRSLYLLFKMFIYSKGYKIVQLGSLNLVYALQKFD